MGTKSLVLSITSGLFLTYVFCSNTVYAELRDIGVKITSPSTGQEIPVGELTIFGISTDDSTTDCQVHVDIDDTKPFQKATATGPMIKDDYSTWIFTYTQDYRLIREGENELTARISCLNGPVNLSKHHTVNIIGVNKSNNNQE